MSVTWPEIDAWRAEKDMQKSDLARMAGIPESTIYRGLKHKSKLQPSMRTIMRGIFPDKFKELEIADV